MQDYPYRGGRFVDDKVNVLIKCPHHMPSSNVLHQSTAVESFLPSAVLLMIATPGLGAQWPANQRLGVQYNICVDEFSPENGATQFLPGASRKPAGGGVERFDEGGRGRARRA